MYADDEDKTRAIAAYKQNHQIIQDILGLYQHWEERTAQTRAKRLQDIEDNKEYINEFVGLIEDTFEDIKNPSVNRVYKLNLEKEGRFDVDIELRNKTELEGVYDPFVDLKQEPDITREEWSKTALDHQKYFDEEHEKMKLWYDEELAKTTRNKWLPISNSEPTKSVIVVDDEIINMAKGFMVGPVGLFRGRAVEAQTQRFDNLPEMQIFLKVQAKTKDMVLYMTFKKDNVYFWRGAFVALGEDTLPSRELC